MKDLFKVLGIFSVFAIMGSATFVKQTDFDPCQNNANAYLAADSLVAAHFYGHIRDTMVIVTQKDSLWDIKTEHICNIFRDSCKRNGSKILVALSVVDPTQWNTPYGKMVYVRTCP